MRVVIANFSKPTPDPHRVSGTKRSWSEFESPDKPPQIPLLEQKHDWGFHIYAIGVYMMEIGIARIVEFWDYDDRNSVSYHSSGVLRVMFLNEADVLSYVEQFGVPDLFINYGRYGRWILDYLENKCFRVHIPCLRKGQGIENKGAECFLVDSQEYLDDHSMLYIPVVNAAKIRPDNCEKVRDFIYIASLYPGKCHDMLLNAIRGTEMTGHLHPVDHSRLDLSGTKVTTSNFNEADVLQLLQTSRIAVYPAGKQTSNPAAMWEYVAADLPVVVNEEMEGGKHVVVPGVTGEISSPELFLETMKKVLRNRDAYSPRKHFEQYWNTLDVLQRYVDFFRRMGFSYGSS